MSQYMRIACAVPAVTVADVKKNTEQIISYMHEADKRNCDLLVFPELALTGYTCQDLFFQEKLLCAVRDGVKSLLRESGQHPNLTVAVGLPVLLEGQIYNCAAVICSGKLLGLVPKTYVPNHNEFDEKRWFGEAADLHCAGVSGEQFGMEKDSWVLVGADLLFRVGNVKVGVEICEDLWAPIPPSSVMTVNGAEVIVNLAASNEGIGKRDFRRDLVKQHSAHCAYAFCSAGCTESTQDLVFSGHSMIAAGRKMVAESEAGPTTDYLLVQDVDLEAIRNDRRLNLTFRQSACIYAKTYRVVGTAVENLRSDGELERIDRFPFVPCDENQRIKRCNEVFDMQVAALVQRLKITGCNAVVGVSGGLDSTLALLVAVEAARNLLRPSTSVYAVTMPCFGTSERTHRNANELIRLLGTTGREINIRNAVLQHFEDIGHDPDQLNHTYENAQARERTQILMDFAGANNAIVIGTGDMSEAALGWCTYNGDHMSMYSVNSSVPKTLISWIIRTVADRPEFAAAQQVLYDILDTPISPELLPPDSEGRISQETEDIVGPYALHDFFLYYMIRRAFAPKKIYRLACRAFADEYAPEVIKKWLTVFYRRFFTQQFKRDCVPNGVKIGSVGLNPRGDWRMPSDASFALWMEDLESL